MKIEVEEVPSRLLKKVCLFLKLCGITYDPKEV